MNTAVLMIAFNRPQYAARILDAVRQAKPARLYVAIDGPRVGREDDRSRVEETKRLFDTIDWDCKVERLIREENLGCKQAVSSAITWFFQHEPNGIILEDDCLPDPSFFPYAEYLLERHADNESVMHINGVNFQNGQWRGSGSYYFSKVCHVWGWATWRRAWQKYDIHMEGLEEFFDNHLVESVITAKGSPDYWKWAFTKTKQGLINTWDYQWVFTVWKNNGLAIMPNMNMISNIGFDAEATHTKTFNPEVSARPLEGLQGVIKDTDILVPDFEGDTYSFSKQFAHKKNTLPARVKRKLKSILNGQD
jgi:hypothetical protein